MMIIMNIIDANDRHDDDDDDDDEKLSIIIMIENKHIHHKSLKSLSLTATQLF